MLSIIVAFDNNYVIGKNNKLIWHIPKDLKRFKELTTGKTIVMGRKTFESLPQILPNRKHIVITQNKDYKVNDNRVEVIYDTQDIIKLKDNSAEYFVIGGGKIYKQLLPYCKRLYLTKIHSEFEGDTYFPEINFDEYNIVNTQLNSEENLKYTFLTLERKE